MNEAKPLPLPELSYLVQPWQHQLTAIERAAPLNEYALFFEMGAGKTMTAINILRLKCMRHRRLLKTLVLCPSIVRDNWLDEFKRHSKLQPGEVCVLEGPGVKRRKTFLKSDAKVFITNYEALVMMKDTVTELLMAWKPEVLILDESHRCKDMRAKRTKAVVKLAESTMYRYILSGSPILNGPMDLFSQFLILDRGQTFGKNFFVFRSEYFYDRNAQMPKQKYFPDWRVKPGAEAKLHLKIGPRSMVVSKKDCMDLPPLVRTKISVELSPLQKKLYDEMKADLITFYEGKACVAELAMVKALRLMEIASGFITIEGDAGHEKVQLKDNPRAQALRELLVELTPHSKVLVWACWKENYRTIRAVLDELKVGYVVVTGEQDDAEKRAAVLRFSTDESCRVFLGNPSSGGIGINLTAAAYSIFYSRTLKLEDDLQAEARNHRGGSEIHEKITRYDLVAKGTIDEKVLAMLQAKVAITDKVLRGLL